jgi:hypothetical protein
MSRNPHGWEQSAFLREIGEKLKSFSRREFTAFKTRDEGLEWLAKD